MSSPAPTSEDAARLLTELEAEAERRVVWRAVPEALPLAVTVMTVRDALRNSLVAHAVMRVNGSEVLARAEVGDHEGRDPQERAELLASTLCGAIARELSRKVLLPLGRELAEAWR